MKKYFLLVAFALLLQNIVLAQTISDYTIDGWTGLVAHDEPGLTETNLQQQISSLTHK